MYIKQFDEWNNIKKSVHNESRETHVRAGEIRWMSCGVNIGSEIDGKGTSFARPALVLHVIGSHLALVVPLSTKMKDVAGYVPFSWKDRTVALCIHQVRVVSQKRLLRRMGRISDTKTQSVKDVLKKFFAL